MSAAEGSQPYVPQGAPTPGESPAELAEQMEGPSERRTRGAHALRVAARLLAGALTFFFLGFAFAYVYLKASNVEHKWNNHHVHPVQVWGVVLVVCLVLSAALIIVASRSQHAGRPWFGPAIASLVLGLVAFIAQIIEYTQQTFGPSNGAYASVFVGWTGFYLVVLLMCIYWLEIQVATDARERRATPADDDPEAFEHPDRLLPRGLDASAFLWTYFVGLGVVMWVLLYLVR